MSQVANSLNRSWINSNSVSSSVNEIWSSCDLILLLGTTIVLLITLVRRYVKLGYDTLNIYIFFYLLLLKKNCFKFGGVGVGFFCLTYKPLVKCEFIEIKIQVDFKY